MNYHRRLSMVCCLMACLSACSPSPAPENNWLHAMAYRITQGYADLNRQSAELATESQAFCDSNPENSAERLSKVRLKWLSTMGAWQKIQWVQFGPVTHNNAGWSIQFWPDKKNLLARKMTQYGKNTQEIAAESIAGASVVIQGISAMELLLFDGDFAAQNAWMDFKKQCQLQLAVARHLQQTTQKLAMAWEEGGYAEQWLTHNNELEEQGQLVEAEGEIFDALLGQMERVKMDKLGGPLGYKNRNKVANGYFSESWRSQSSLNNIRANIDAFAQALNDPDYYDLSKKLIDAGHTDLANQLLELTVTVQNSADSLTQPLSQMVNSEEGKIEVDKLYQQVGDLNSLLKNQVAPALGIVLGFNSNDGD